MAAAMLYGGVPSAVARALARERAFRSRCSSASMWAVDCLAERNVKLNPRELQQLSMVTGEAHGNVPLGLQVTEGAGARRGAAGHAGAAGGQALVVFQVRDCRLPMQVVVE